MADNYKILNDAALTALDRGEFDKAQDGFRSNAKRFPNGCTLNNLGVFYCTCGMRQRNGKLVSAWKIGLKYLLKAAAIDKNAVIYGNVGMALFKQNMFIEAFNYFNEARSLHCNCLFTYNMAVCKYMSGSYDEAKELLSLVLDKASADCILNACGSHPIFPFCFSIISLGLPTKLAEEAIYPFIDELHNTNEVYDLFMLLFTLGNYKEAWSCVELLVSCWTIDKQVGAKICKCAEQVGAEADIKKLKENGFVGGDSENIVPNQICISDYKYIPACATIEPWLN